MRWLFIKGGVSGNHRCLKFEQERVGKVVGFHVTVKKGEARDLGTKEAATDLVAPERFPAQCHERSKPQKFHASPQPRSNFPRLSPRLSVLLHGRDGLQASNEPLAQTHSKSSRRSSKVTSWPESLTSFAGHL